MRHPTHDARLSKPIRAGGAAGPQPACPARAAARFMFTGGSRFEP